MIENKDTGALWEIVSIGRAVEGHGQTGMEVTLANKDLPFNVKVSAPMVPDEAVQLGADYIKTVLNMMDVKAIHEKTINQVLGIYHPNANLSPNKEKTS